MNLEIDTYNDLIRLKESVKESEIHLVKECMVLAMAPNSSNINAHPIVIWPTCSKNEISIGLDPSTF